MLKIVHKGKWYKGDVVYIIQNRYGKYNTKGDDLFLRPVALAPVAWPGGPRCEVTDWRGPLRGGGASACVTVTTH